MSAHFVEINEIMTVSHYYSFSFLLVFTSPWLTCTFIFCLHSLGATKMQHFFLKFFLTKLLRKQNNFQNKKKIFIRYAYHMHLHYQIFLLYRKIYLTYISLLHHSEFTWSRGYKIFSCSTQLSMKIFLLINVKMPTVVGILTFMSGKNCILGLPEPKK